MIDKVLNRISLFLAGVLTTSVIFAIVIKTINNTFGLLLAFVACIVMSYFGIKKTEKESKQRIVIYGIITALITITILSIIVWQLLANSLESVL